LTTQTTDSEDKTIPIGEQLRDEEVLQGFLGERIAKLVDRCGANSNESLEFVSEPTGNLRGVRIDVVGGGWILAIISSDEPLYKSFRKDLKWNMSEVLQTKIGGLQYHDRSGVYEVGNIPFQWRFRKGPVFDHPSRPSQEL
jgi:hypothetical protein